VLKGEIMITQNDIDGLIAFNNAIRYGELLEQGYKDIDAQKRRIEFANIEDVGTEIPK
jgi:predicted O-methyltransferase YrrM